MPQLRHLLIRQLLHRDIKPANILLNDYGGPALSDFGIAGIPGSFETGKGIVAGSPRRLLRWRSSQRW